MTGTDHNWGELPYESARLMAKFLQDDISAQETEQLHTLLDAATREKVLNTFKDTPAFQQRLAYLRQLDKKAAWKKVLHKQKRSRRYAWRRRLGYAAAAALLAIGALYWLTVPKADDRIVADLVYGYKNDVLPGTTQAELTLSNGEKVILRKDSVELQEEDGTRLRSNHGALQYSAGALVQQESAILYNTLRVPAAGTFHLRLPDGTGVWLNAASELTFPVRFPGSERRVELKGEGYFEVAQDAGRPFTVTVNNNEIHVMGTSFNIAAYSEQHTATTLLSGKVAVAAQGKNIVLKPGQQAVAVPGSLTVHAADVEAVTAWKNGYFYFNETTITGVMEQLSRWYGITVAYHGNISRSVKYGGSISRDAKLGEVLEQLKTISTLHFHIDGKKLTVSSGPLPKD